MKTIILLTCSIFALVLTGCHTGTWQYVKLPDQKKQIEDPAKARIYVLRQDSVANGASARISDGSKLIGNTGPGGYLCWERLPGETIIKGISKGESTVPLTVAAGDIYYIFQQTGPGWIYGTNSLEVINDEKGQTILKSCKPPTPTDGPTSSSVAMGNTITLSRATGIAGFAAPSRGGSGPVGGGVTINVGLPR